TDLGVRQHEVRLKMAAHTHRTWTSEHPGLVLVIDPEAILLDVDQPDEREERVRRLDAGMEDAYDQMHTYLNKHSKLPLQRAWMPTLWRMARGHRDSEDREAAEMLACYGDCLAGWILNLE